MDISKTKSGYAQALSSLSEGMQAVWTLYTEHDLSINDIAQHMNLPYLISKGDGHPITADGYRKLWKSLSSHIELYGMTAINFRTTFCTMMVASGVDIKTAQALTGHATPEMTLKVYAKQEESRIPDAIEKVYSFLAAQ